jgi:drug/metabolite transporter (DMT)-like permease
MSQNDQMPQSSLSAALYALGAFAVFATHDVVIKLLGGNYTAFQIIFFGALFSFPVITILLMREAEPGTLRPNNPGWVALRSVSGALAALGAFYAFSQLPLAQVYAAIFAMPLLITVLSVPILGETVRMRRGIAVLVGLVGVLVVLRPGAGSFGIGHLAALLCACAGALNSIVVRKLGTDERPVVMILYPMMTNFVLMLIAMPFVYVPMPLQDMALMAVVSVLGLVAMFMLIQAYLRGPAVLVAPMQYSQIIWAVLFGVLFFEEYPDLWTYVGTAIIIASGLYILRRESDETVSSNRPVLRTRTRPGQATSMRVGSVMKFKNRVKD